VHTLAQFGPDITGDVDTVLALFLRFGLSEATPPPEALITEMIAGFSRLAMESVLICDVGGVVRALATLVSKLSLLRELT
jgi:CCR4-NOT transcription complex subunit 1